MSIFRSKSSRILLAMIGLAFIWSLISEFYYGQTVITQTGEVPKIRTIHWSDGDSGRINGSIKFKINNADAPEIGSPQCEQERQRGEDSQQWAINFTQGAELSITRAYGTDNYDRLIIDLAVDGADFLQTGEQRGYLKTWAHRGTKPLTSKPNWC